MAMSLHPCSHGDIVKARMVAYHTTRIDTNVCTGLNKRKEFPRIKTRIECPKCNIRYYSFIRPHLALNDSAFVDVSSKGVYLVENILIKFSIFGDEN